MKYILLFLCLCSMSLDLYSQDELLKELEQDKDETEYTFATFKGTRIINGHSVETKHAGTLEFIFSHRFGRINQGWYEMYGLDQAFVRIGLDYGITDRLSISLGRNSVNKTIDGYFKYKLLQQRTGASALPVTVTGLGGLAYRLEPRRNVDVAPGFKNVDRLAYTAQLLIARKFTQEFSLQLMPTLVHKNAVDQAFEDNNQIALGAGGRYKITPSVAITGEYYHNLSIKDNSPYHNVVGVGLDIETGGHVFQLVFTNAIGLTERAFITETRDDFFEGDIHFGFNVTRTFQFRKGK
jgi:hypothetical protein